MPLVPRGNISSNVEANASELLENIEDMFPFHYNVLHYYIQIDVCTKYSTSLYPDVNMFFFYSLHPYNFNSLHTSIGYYNIHEHVLNPRNISSRFSIKMCPRYYMK